MGRTPTSKKAYFAEGHVKRNMEEYLTVMNPSSRKASLNLTLTYGDGYSKMKKYEVAPRSRRTIHINSLGMGIYRYCDAVGVHLFNTPSEGFRSGGNRQARVWVDVYTDLRNYLASKSITDTELAVTSCGWPHADKVDTSAYNPVERNYHTQAYQALALSEGIQSLADAGCRKIWVFKDVDDRIGSDDYFGLFSYISHKPFVEEPKPNSGWWVYVEKSKQFE